MDDLPTILPPNRYVDHRIEVHLRFTPPIKAPYRLNQKELEEFKRQINDLMETSCIRPSKSPYNDLMLFVGKKDGKLKMCIDYQALNKTTIRNNYPLFRIYDLFNMLNEA